MRAWFADGDELHGVADLTAVGRSVGKFLAWRRGEQVHAAPELLRVTAFEPFVVGVRVGEAERARLRDETEIPLAGERATVDDVVAVERVLDRYPSDFERLFPDATARVVLERRGGERLAVDGELVEVTT